MPMLTTKHGMGITGKHGCEGDSGTDLEGLGWCDGVPVRGREGQGWIEGLVLTGRFPHQPTIKKSAKKQVFFKF